MCAAFVSNEMLCPKSAFWKERPQTEGREKQNIDGLVERDAPNGQEAIAQEDVAAQMAMEEEGQENEGVHDHGEEQMQSDAPGDANIIQDDLCPMSEAGSDDNSVADFE